MTDDTWTIYASSGEYSETAGSAIIALAQFMTSHPDDFVAAVVCDGMEPPLMLRPPPVDVVAEAIVPLEGHSRRYLRRKARRRSS